MQKSFKLSEVYTVELRMPVPVGGHQCTTDRVETSQK